MYCPVCLISAMFKVLAILCVSWCILLDMLHMRCSASQICFIYILCVWFNVFVILCAVQHAQYICVLSYVLIVLFCILHWIYGHMLLCVLSCWMWCVTHYCMLLIIICVAWFAQYFMYVLLYVLIVLCIAPLLNVPIINGTLKFQKLGVVMLLDQANRQLSSLYTSHAVHSTINYGETESQYTSVVKNFTCTHPGLPNIPQIRLIMSPCFG